MTRLSRSGQAIGFRPHTGWAIAVVIDGKTVVDRQRIDIAPKGMPRDVFHSAVGRKDAAAFVDKATKLAFEAAGRALADFDVTSAGIAAEPRSLPALSRILEVHMLLHAAEGDLYRAALEDACAARGWPLVQLHPKSLDADAWKGAASSPWQADHRLAAAAALRSVG